MKRNLLQKSLFSLLTGVVILFTAGCSKPVSGELSTDTSVVTEPVPSVTTVVTETPVPTPTSIPVATATPTPSPTPTELPFYDQILAWEKEHEPDVELPVKAALLVNLSNNEILYSAHATEVIYPASITKLMTALVVFNQKEFLTETVEVSQTAVTPVIPSAKMCGFQAGDRLLLRDLLGCMLIYSGNDTSVAVAEHISGSEAEFVALMNQTAEELGLTVSKFYNTHGLPDDNHVTSAYDIYLIMQKLFQFDEFFDIIESGSIKVDVLRNETLTTMSFVSTNQFLSGAYQLPEGLTIFGGKTGTTNKAGCCLTLYIKDQRGDCYIAEIFGAESYETLYPDMIHLLSYISVE